MKGRQFFGVLMLLLSHFLPINIVNATTNQTINQEDYIQWLEIYQDYPQFEAKEIDRMTEKIAKLTEYPLQEDEVIALLGQPSNQYDVGQSRFLEYYAVDQEESKILSVQLFSDAENLDQSTGYPYILAAYDYQYISQASFEPLNISEDMIEDWKDLDQDIFLADIQEKLGKPDNLTYYFESGESRYEWIHITDEEDIYKYIGVVVGKDGQVRTIGIPEIIYQIQEEDSVKDENSTSSEEN